MDLITNLIYPWLSHNDVMNDNGGPSPCIVTLTAMEDKVAAPHRVAGYILAPEADCHGPLLPEDPLPMLHIVGKHWGMVANLEGQKMYIV